jgi:hypothetical protein
MNHNGSHSRGVLITLLEFREKFAAPQQAEIVIILLAPAEPQIPSNACNARCSGRKSLWKRK